MNLSITLKPRTIALVLGCIAVLLALQSIYAEYVLSTILGLDSNSAPARLLDVFSVNREESIPTWYSTINLFLAAALLLWVALMKRVHREPFARYWAGLAVIFLYLSMDEGAAIHEATSGPLQSAFDSTGFLEFGWLILGMPLVALFGILYFRFWLRLPRDTRMLFLVAAALYVGGGVIIESISANQYALDGGSSLTYLTIATFEELFEMLGVVVLIYALLSYSARHDYRVSLIFQSAPEETVLSASRRAFPLWRVAILFAVVLIVVNGGLLLWGVLLLDQYPPVAAAPYHFYILVEQLADENVTIAHFAGVYDPANETARRMAQSLLDAFEHVQIISLPALNASVAIAGNGQPLEASTLTDLMQWIGETEYIFYDTPLVRAIATLP